MLLNVNTHANSVIESSFALMKFMEVLMNVYLPYFDAFLAIPEDLSLIFFRGNMHPDLPLVVPR